MTDKLTEICATKRVEVAARKSQASLGDLDARAGTRSAPRGFHRALATKAATSHLSRHLRVELGPKGVRVSMIEPGIVATELQSHFSDQGAIDWLENTRETIEWLRAEDVAEAIAFTVGLPSHVNLQQVTIMPTRQAT